MNLRDKVAAIFSTDSTSASSDEGCDAMISSKDGSVRFREQAQLCDVASRLAPPPLQPQSPFLEPSHSQALATPAPQKHPQPASHVSDNVSGIHASLPPPTPCGRAAEQRPLPHVALLMMRKGALDSIASRNFNLPEQAVALLLAASSMVLPLGNFDWQHVRSIRSNTCPRAFRHRPPIARAASPQKVFAAACSTSWIKGCFGGIAWPRCYTQLAGRTRDEHLCFGFYISALHSDGASYFLLFNHCTRLTA
jgi:hypothetical protein